MRFPSAPGLDVVAPGLLQQEWREAEAFGAATWLWMQADTRRETPVKWLSTLLLPAIAHRQFLLATEAGQPVFFLSWANFSDAAEHRYVNGPRATMTTDDWVSGDRMWIIDWIAPFGHTTMMSTLLKQQLFASLCMRSLYHRGTERGLRIKNFCGRAVNPAEASAWFASHPVAIGAEFADGPSDSFQFIDGASP